MRVRCTKQRHDKLLLLVGDGPHLDVVFPPLKSVKGIEVADALIGSRMGETGKPVPLIERLSFPVRNTSKIKS